MTTNKPDLNALITSKLQELGAYFDDELPSFIMMLIEKEKPVSEIREDLSMILDPATDVFIEWLGKYLEEEKSAGWPSSTAVQSMPVTLDTDLNDDQLDFEENLDEETADEPNEQQSSQTLTSTQSSDTDELQRTKEEAPIEQKRLKSDLNVNSKRPHHTLESNISSDNKPKVIKLNSSQHLNDIGLMRRKAALNQPNSNATNANDVDSKMRNRIQRFASNHSDEDITDLREKLNRMRQQHQASNDTVEQQENQRRDTNVAGAAEESAANDDKKEKCRFWPLCKNGANCVYFHPTEQCVAFPTCKSGEKCLFIHPLCKFDAVCTKKDCPFTHITKKSVSYLPAVTTMCKFFPNCFNSACPFLHPKMCMFGSNCKNTNCPFTHADPKAAVAKPHQLKWSSKKENGEATENKEPNPNADPSQPEPNLVLIIKDSNE